jgi:phenylalanine-4-hydroxylase
MKEGGGKKTSVGEAPRGRTPGDEQRLSLLVALKDRPGALESVLKLFSAAGVNLTHIESRPARGDRFDIYVDCEGDRRDPAIRRILEALEQEGVQLLVLDHQTVPWFPRHARELDLIARNTLDAGVELTADHPGFDDPVYRKSRARIDRHARAYRYGQSLPVIDYSDRDTATWRQVYETLRPLHERYACSAYLNSVSELETAAGFGSEQIPQAASVSAFLTERTGFRIHPVPGLLASRDFLAGLAFRVFFSTQYVRHHSRPLYTPEPDVCHELIGHVPMFADAAFADFSQEIGLASLGATDAEIECLARCYWYSVEFGLLREGDGLKAYGAGLLSSAGELVYACGGDQKHAEPRPVPERLDWDPRLAAERPFPITDYQSCYFVARSLQDAKQRMRDHCRQLPRPFYARFNPASGSIWVDQAVRRER